MEPSTSSSFFISPEIIRDAACRERVIRQEHADASFRKIVILSSLSIDLCHGHFVLKVNNNGIRGLHLRMGHQGRSCRRFADIKESTEEQGKVIIRIAGDCNCCEQIRDRMMTIRSKIEFIKVWQGSRPIVPDNVFNLINTVDDRISQCLQPFSTDEKKMLEKYIWEEELDQIVEKVRGNSSTAARLDLMNGSAGSGGRLVEATVTTTGHNFCVEIGLRGLFQIEFLKELFLKFSYSTPSTTRKTVTKMSE